MNQREFYDWMEKWFGLMCPGFVASFGAIQDAYARMDTAQKNMARSYAEWLTYERFLLTPYWYAIRLEMFRLGHGRCKTCRDQLDLGGFEIHHTTYKNHGSEHEHLDELKLLCSRCHSIITEACKTIRAQERVA